MWQFESPWPVNCYTPFVVTDRDIAAPALELAGAENGVSPAAEIDLGVSELEQSPRVTLARLAQGAERIGGMVVRSAQVRKVLKTIARLSPYKATVLIYGESGTGKELVARALHTLGPDAQRTVRHFQLLQPGRIAGRVSAIRPCERRFHRRARGFAWLLPLGQRRHAVPRRDRRVAAEAAAQALARGRDPRDSAGGLVANYKVDIRLVAATNRDLRAMVKAGRVPRRSVLSAQHGRDLSAAAARAARGDRALSSRISSNTTIGCSARQVQLSRSPRDGLPCSPTNGPATSANSPTRSRAR